MRGFAPYNGIMDISTISPDAVSRFLDRVHDTCFQQPSNHAHRSVEELAGDWRKLGLRPGDLVVLALPNGLEFLRQFFAVLAAGGVPAPVAPNIPSSQLHDLIRAMALGQWLRCVRRQRSTEWNGLPR